MVAVLRIGVAMLAVLAGGATVAPGQRERPDIVSMDEAAKVLPTPVRLTIWADRRAYLKYRDLVRVYLATDPRGDRRRVREFLFLEHLESGERRYLVDSGDSSWLSADIVDFAGRPPWRAEGTPLRSRPASQIWAGRLGPGLWQFVAELRSLDTTEIVKRAVARFVVSPRIPVVTGAPDRVTEIVADTTWKSDTIVAIRGRLFVNEGATLTIEPGTVVLARGPETAIVVEPGGRIVADAHREAPIVMTCDEAVGQRLEGCWGGLLVQGRAPVTPGSEGTIGVVPPMRAAFGGEDPQESSGILRFVRVEFAGAGPQCGGLGFYGVGSGTVIDHVQSHASACDGIRFVGGTGSCRYCVSSGALDDGLEWELGWHGTAQFLFIQQDQNGGDNGIEGNLAVLDSGTVPRSFPSLSGIPGRGDFAAGPFGGAPGQGVPPRRAPARDLRTLPRLYNLTVIGGAIGASAVGGRGHGILLGGTSTVRARNVIVMGFGSRAIGPANRVKSLFGDGLASFANAILHIGGTLTVDRRTSDAAEAEVRYLNADPRLVNVRYEANPDPRPRLSSPALAVGAAAVPPGDGFLDTSAQWVGGFGHSNWLEGWTYFGSEEDYRALPADETK